MSAQGKAAGEGSAAAGTTAASSTNDAAPSARWLRALWPAAIILPLVIVFAVSFGNDPHAVPFVLADKPAPPLNLKAMQGSVTDQPFSLAAHAGKVVVLNFWSSWCQPCKIEHELLQQASRMYEGRVQFVGVIYEDTEEAARGYLNGRSNFYPQYVDPGSHAAIDFGVSGVPETYFVDRQGIVRHKHAGAIDPPTLHQKLATLLEAR